MVPVKTLLIDNYDSYSYNLYQLIAQVNGEVPTVVYNDELSLETIIQHINEGRYHNIVISPGPGTPANPEDIGVCLGLLQAKLRIPILGVCLGHQALAQAFGARVVRAPEPVHGRLSFVAHTGHRLFHNIPSGNEYHVVRYHSLIVDANSLPQCLQPIAWTVGLHHALGLDVTSPRFASSGGGAVDSNASAAFAHFEQLTLEEEEEEHEEHDAGGDGRSSPVAVDEISFDDTATTDQHSSSSGTGSPTSTSPPGVVLATAIDTTTNTTTTTAAITDIHATTTTTTTSSSSQGHQPSRSLLNRIISRSSSTAHAGLIMGLAHTQLPYYAVQYHPESIATGFGTTLLSNFKDLTCQFYGLVDSSTTTSSNPSSSSLIPTTTFNEQSQQQITPSSSSIEHQHQQQQPNLRVCCAALRGILPHLPGDPSETLFTNTVLGCSSSTTTTSTSSISDTTSTVSDTSNTFWLDSSATDRGRFSFMGGLGGSLWKKVTYKLPLLQLQHQPQGTLTTYDKQGNTTSVATTQFWPWLSSELQHWQCSTTECSFTQLDTATSSKPTTTLDPLLLENNNTANNQNQQRKQQQLEFQQGNPLELLPFNCWGGYIGYLGYELKSESGGKMKHVSTSPDAAFFLSDQLLAVDHETGDVYVVALHSVDSAKDALAAQQWVTDKVGEILQLASSASASSSCSNGVDVGTVVKQQQQQHSSQQQQQQEVEKESIVFNPRENHEAYLDNIEACMQALHAGDSYEICLTTMLSTSSPPPPWPLYLTLRHINPAPYAAWLSFGSHCGPTICCSSPERFLRGERGGRLEAKPIKGTARRVVDNIKADAASAAALESSEKDRAENLMIVDLLRNDLGRVCETGTVHVPALMQVESFATVHQLVSTVKGSRRKDASVVDCIKAAFPGGSMTGAPKIRTMQIIDALEQGPRGVYSGSIGYISFNDTFDLNIVIRTAIYDDSGDTSGCTIGAGGAIVAQSEPEGEWEEMTLKCAALLRAVSECSGSQVVSLL